MTIAERNNKLKHFISCLKCEVSGKCCDVNCSTQYDAGNMGEIIENLEAISKALEQEPRKDEVILTKEEYGKLVSNEFDNGYAKGYREALEQEPILDKVKQAREDIENEVKFWSEPSKYNVKPIIAIENAKAQSYKHCLEIIDKLIAESEK